MMLASDFEDYQQMVRPIRSQSDYLAIRPVAQELSLPRCNSIQSQSASRPNDIPLLRERLYLRPMGMRQTRQRDHGSSNRAFIH
jgi:hypothetical protein